MRQPLSKRVSLAGGLVRRVARMRIQEWLSETGRDGGLSYESYLRRCELDPETHLLHCELIWRTQIMSRFNAVCVTLEYVPGTGYDKVEYVSEAYNVDI